MSSLSKIESKPAVRYVGRRQYNVKAFSAQQVSNPVNEPRSTEIDGDFIYDDFEESQPAYESFKRSRGMERGQGMRYPYRTMVNSSDRRASSPAYHRPQLESAWYYDSETKPKKRSWWKGLATKALVLTFVLAVMFFLFRPISSSAEDSGPLSMNLPQILSKMLPQLNIFVQATGDDMVQIGKAYMDNKGAVTQSLDPGQSLDSMIAGIKDINKEMSNTDSGNSMWDQVQNVFKSMRQEAWSVATRGGK